MLLIGLTGGIASGKSTVAKLLAEKGARVIDADAIGKQLYEPGGPARDEVKDRFGTTDRKELAEKVFSDPEALADLNAITHPKIMEEVSRRIAEVSDDDAVVVLDAALLIEFIQGRKEGLGLDAIVVVAADVEQQMARMLDDRGMTEPEARARIDAQTTTEEKMAVADFIVDNRGSREDTRKAVETLWRELKDMLTAESS